MDIGDDIGTVTGHAPLKAAAVAGVERVKVIGLKDAELKMAAEI
jgi:hypothetical protein